MKGFCDHMVDFIIQLPQRMIDLLNRPFHELKMMFIIAFAVFLLILYFWWFILWQ